ncbi:hypothetical protein C0W35_07240 [Photobacterium kishitanii]|uniref:hypothetical protein n=1 Tax=Photobacterium kishitanii TaxID=318456 RepID=UPI000D178983|nr:hypothetical protein [Photobacterium kishitanii]PSU95377.1 hypothetical protein C0W35_07240 [Photobacterium kishitanii]
MKKLLVIGKLPPPIGGVTIHLKRLVLGLEINKIDFDFFDLNKIKPSKLIFNIFQYKLIHNHSSNPYFRFLFSLYCNVFKKKLITTFHGNIGRYGFFKNKLDIFTLKLTHTPIVLNDQSLKIALKYNKNSKKITSFIPPSENEIDVNFTLINSELISKYKGNIYCTNASAFNFDSNGNEIYSILLLIDIFYKLKDKLLIISDPSCQYFDYLNLNNITLPKNIMVISGEHCFFNVIRISDTLIRATITDGDSISIKEALYINKTVIASAVVYRPLQCLTYKNKSKLIELINTNNYKVNKYNFKENAIVELIELYKSIY